MKKIVAITMAAIMGIGLFSLVGCGNSEDGKTVTFVLKRPSGKQIDFVAFHCNGENLTPYGFRADNAPNNENDKNSPRVKIIKNVHDKVFPGLNELEFSVSGLSPDDEVVMKMGLYKRTGGYDVEYYISDKIQVKNKKRITFSEFHINDSPNKF